MGLEQFPCGSSASGKVGSLKCAVPPTEAPVALAVAKLLVDSFVALVKKKTLMI